MSSLFDGQFFLLAEGDWSRLIGVIVVVGFWIISAAAKMWSKNASGEDDEAERTSRAVELAKKYAKQKQSQAKPARNSEFMSEWDRRQEMKRLQRMAQLRKREIQPPKPVKPAVVPPIPKQPKPIPTVKSPEFKPVSQLARIRQYARQVKTQQQPPRPVSVPQTYKTPRKKKPVTHKKSAAAATIKTSSHPLHVLLKHPDQLRSAIVLKEILDKPIALRTDCIGF